MLPEQGLRSTEQRRTSLCSNSCSLARFYWTKQKHKLST